MASVLCGAGLAVLAGVLPAAAAKPQAVRIDVAAERLSPSPAAADETVSSLEAALDWVRKDNAARQTPAVYAINLQDPKVAVAAPIAIDGLKLKPGSGITITGRPDAGTIISGAFRAEPFLKSAKASNEEYRYTLALADLPPARKDALTRKLAAASPQELMVRVNGSRMIHPTRWPAQGFLKDVEIGSSPGNWLASLSFGAAVPDIKGTTGLWVSGYLTNEYLFVNAPVEAVDAAGRVWIPRSRLSNDGTPPERLYLHNLKTFIRCDAFFYDPQSRSLNFCTTSPIEKLELSAADALLNVSDSDEIRFTNIVFEMAGGDAVTVRNSRHIDIANTIVRLTGGDGIIYSNVSDSIVSKVTVHDTGGRAVWLSGGDRNTLTASGLVLEDSLLHDFSQVQRTYTPAIQADGVGIIIRRNVAFNGPQSALMYSGNDHLVEDNIFAQLVTESGDAGFIYTGQDFTSQGTVIRGNVLLGTGSRYFQNARGICLDEFSSGNTLTGNVIVSIPYGILMNGGKDNTFTSNIFVLSTPSIWAAALGYAPWWQPWKNDHLKVPDGLTVKNLYRLPIDSEPWTSRYPHLRSYRNSNLLEPERNKIERNVFLGASSITTSDAKLQTATARGNKAVVFAGPLEFLERLRNRIHRSELPRTLQEVYEQLDRHGISHSRMIAIDHAGARLSASPLAEAQ
ncbi:NosD domain-containing protein [Afipia sp. TerB]